MNYQLVLQWSSSIRTFDEMLAAEDALTNDIGDVALVDGHDAGSGEGNIFLLTDSPELAFEVAKRILTEKGLPAFVRYSRGRDVSAACGQLALIETVAAAPTGASAPR